MPILQIFNRFHNQALYRISYCTFRERGKLSLNDSLSKYFLISQRNSVTIHHLLTHTSGIRDYHSLPDWKEDSQRDITPKYTVMRMAAEPFDFEPGTDFRYSNTGYILLGLIIEQISGKSFEQFIQDKILTPLKLHHTGVLTNEKSYSWLSQGLHINPRESKTADYINYNQPFSSGNMYSTPTDLWKFTKAVMSSQILAEGKTTEIFENNDGKYGYGWGIRDFDGTKAFGHYGGMNGFIGSITWLPKEDYFICILTNDDNTPKYNITEDLVSTIKGNSASTRAHYT